MVRPHNQEASDDRQPHHRLHDPYFHPHAAWKFQKSIKVASR